MLLSSPSSCLVVYLILSLSLSLFPFLSFSLSNQNCLTKKTLPKTSQSSVLHHQAGSGGGISACVVPSTHCTSLSSPVASHGPCKSESNSSILTLTSTNIVSSTVIEEEEPLDDDCGSSIGTVTPTNLSLHGTVGTSISARFTGGGASSNLEQPGMTMCSSTSSNSLRPPKGHHAKSASVSGRSCSSAYEPCELRPILDSNSTLNEHIRPRFEQESVVYFCSSRSSFAHFGFVFLTLIYLLLNLEYF